MNIPNLPKPTNPRFSSGPTRKPSEWSLDAINKQYLGRYHRSTDVKDYVEKQLKNRGLSAFIYCSPLYRSCVQFIPP